MCKLVISGEAHTPSQAEFLTPQEWHWALNPPGAEGSRLLVQQAPLEAGSLKLHRECCGTAVPLRQDFQKNGFE